MTFKDKTILIKEFIHRVRIRVGFFVYVNYRYSCRYILYILPFITLKNIWKYIFYLKKILIKKCGKKYKNYIKHILYSFFEFLANVQYKLILPIRRLFATFVPNIAFDGSSIIAYITVIGCIFLANYIIF